MFTMSIVALLIVIAIGMFIVKKVTFEREEHSIRGLATIPLVLALVLLFFSSITIVDGSAVGVLKTFGNYDETTLSSGINFVAPWSDVSEVNVRTQTYTMSGKSDEGDVNGDDSITVQTRDIANVIEEVTIRYSVSKSQAANVIQDVGEDFINQLLRPSARKSLRDEAANYDATEFVTSKRSEYADRVLKALQEDLGPRGIEVEAVQIRDQKLPDSVQTGANDKVKAAQDAEKQDLLLVAALRKADIKRTQAKATADSQQIQACGGTASIVKDDAGKDRTVITPNYGAQCDQSQLTPEFLQLQYIQALSELVNAPNNSTLILPTDSNLTPLLNMGQK